LLLNGIFRNLVFEINKWAMMETGYQNHQWDVIQFGAFPSVNPSVKVKTESLYRVNNDEAPLSVACSQGRFEMVKQLIENGSDVNQKDHSNLTPIMRAALNGHQTVVELLIRKGAKISYSLLCTVKAKIEILEENAKAGQEDPFSVVKWKNFLDYLIVEGKKQ
jgi:hypothetical protein